MAVVTTYFDGHNAIVDSGSAWTNDANAANGNTTNFATANAYGGGALGTGTRLVLKGVANPGGIGTITQVRVRAYATGSILNVIHDQGGGGGADNASSVRGSVGAGTYSSYTTLTTPTGGWTLTKLLNLESSSRTDLDDDGTAGNLYRLDVEVTHTPLPAITLDAFSSTSNSYSNTATWSHTVASGANRILVVGIAMLGDAPPVHDAVSVTYNGDALTKIRDDNTAGVHTELWYRVGPDVGTANVVVTHDGSFTTSWFVGTARSFINVDSTSPIDQQGTSSTVGALSTTLTTTGEGAMLVDIAVKYNTAQALTANVGQTANLVSTGGAGWGLQAGSSYKAATLTGAYTTGYTYADGNDGVMSSIALKQAPAVTTIAVTSVSIDQTDPGISVGDTAQLTATVDPPTATDQTVSWSSSATGVATVNSSTGVVTAVSAGSATITVTTTDGGFTDTLPMVIRAPITADTFVWKGYTWERRDTPGSPMYSGGAFSYNNVMAPNGSNEVVIRITNPMGNAPTGGEMFTTGQTFGYGTYTSVVSAPLSTMHKNIVFGGMFTYSGPPPTYNEIDLHEASAWSGGPSQDWPVTLDHVYWPPDGLGDRTSVAETVNMPSDLVQTHRLIWEPGRLTFDSFVGVGTGGTLINNTVQTTNVPTPGGEQIHYNVWVFDEPTFHYGDPDGATPIDITLKDFTFVPSHTGKMLQMF